MVCLEHERLFSIDGTRTDKDGRDSFERLVRVEENDLRFLAQRWNLAGTTPGNIRPRKWRGVAAVQPGAAHGDPHPPVSLSRIREWPPRYAHRGARGAA